jgi:hypothetical protein
MTFLRNSALEQRLFGGETDEHVEDARSTGGRISRSM